MLVKLVQDHIGIAALAQFNHNTHSFTAGFITQVCDTVDTFFLDQLGDLFDQTGFVDHVGQFSSNDPLLAAGQGFNLRDRTNLDLALTCTVSLIDAIPAQDHGAGREVRTLDDLHQFVDICLPVFKDFIINDADNRIDGFPQIVGRDIGGHTDSDTCSTVNQQIGKSGGQNHRFFFGLIKVRREINGILVDIRHHLHGNLAESGLCISHGGCAVTVD